MNDRKLYEQILGISEPWHVEQVELKLEIGQVLIRVEGSPAAEVSPECGERSPRYDASERRWRHLDTCQYQTILIAKVPRTKCSEHGVKQVRVPWAEERSRFTALFEALVISWLQATENIAAVAKGMCLSWEQVSAIRSRAVARGLKRRGRAPLPACVGVDETSITRGKPVGPGLRSFANGKLLRNRHLRRLLQAVAIDGQLFGPTRGECGFVVSPRSRAGRRASKRREHAIRPASEHCQQSRGTTVCGQR